MAALPRTMTAVEISQPGGPEVLKVVERPVPQPAAGEILIKVAVAGVNRPDCLQRAGAYPPPPGASDLPGLEVSGTVVAVGSKARGFRQGDQVCALVSGGGYAEYCTAPAPQTLPVPPGLSATQAGAIPETFFTVWTNVFERGYLAPGEILLVHGGASGIGTTAIQLARSLGSRVIATVGSAEKAEVCSNLGAERVVNYREEDFVAAVKAATNDRGVDVILDMVGGDYTPRNLACLAPDGRLVQIAFLRGSNTEIDLNPVMRKRLTITGSTLRPRSVEQKGAIARALHENVWSLLEEGKVAPVIDSVFPLAEAAKAHALMESNTNIGKILLRVEESH